MKKILVACLSVLLIVFISCKGSGKHAAKDDTAIKADSAYQEVLRDHDKGMSGWMKIERIQKEIKKQLDSLALLPAGPRAAAEQFKTELRELSTILKAAYDQMDKWMTEMNLDSAKNDPVQKLKYFTEERQKIEGINDLISNSLRKANSVLKGKF